MAHTLGEKVVSKGMAHDIIDQNDSYNMQFEAIKVLLLISRERLMQIED